MTMEDPTDPPHKPDSRNRLSALVIDWDLYGRYLADSDLSEADKRLLIETLWSIMVSFVDLGFRLNPVAESCGQAGRPGAEATGEGLAVLDCEDTLTTQAFEDAAAGIMAPSSPGRTDAS